MDTFRHNQNIKVAKDESLNGISAMAIAEAKPHPSSEEPVEVSLEIQ